MVVRYGVDCIYYCDFVDEEVFDMFEVEKECIFVGLVFGLVYNCIKEGDVVGLMKDVVESMGFFRKFEVICVIYYEICKCGVCVVVGGDYGFLVIFMGQNVCDIEYFVWYFGYLLVEVLCCVIVVGVQLMGWSYEFGQVWEGFLVDLFLVCGDVVSDVFLVQKQVNFVMIMKDGVLWKDLCNEVDWLLGLIQVVE